MQKDTKGRNFLGPQNQMKLIKVCLSNHLKKYGEIENVEVRYDFALRRPKMAFVTFYNRQSKEEALRGSLQFIRDAFCWCMDRNCRVHHNDGRIGMEYNGSFHFKRGHLVSTHGFLLNPKNKKQK